GNLAYNLPAMQRRAGPPLRQSMSRFEETVELPQLALEQSSLGESYAGASVARNAAIVGGAFVASRLLGVLREVAIAAEFGTSADYDAYVAAFRIPDLLFLIVMSGA